MNLYYSVKYCQWMQIKLLFSETSSARKELKHSHTFSSAGLWTSHNFFHLFFFQICNQVQVGYTDATAPKQSQCWHTHTHTLKNWAHGINQYRTGSSCVFEYWSPRSLSCFAEPPVFQGPRGFPDFHTRTNTHTFLCTLICTYYIIQSFYSFSCLKV